MIKVGLTGGYASGKTFVASELERLGCHLIYADRLGHAALEPGGAAYEAVLGVFGPSILNHDGELDRKKLASIVFEDPDLLTQLEGIVHPTVFQLEQQILASYSESDPTGITVVEAAILIEAGRSDIYDRLIVTVCSLETQIARAMRRDGVTREEALSRIRKQMPLEAKKAFADYVIDTDAEKQATLLKVRELYDELKKVAENVT